MKRNNSELSIERTAALSLESRIRDDQKTGINQRYQELDYEYTLRWKGVGMQAGSSLSRNELNRNKNEIERFC